MKDVYVYNKDLELIGIVDAYNSLIWASRYWAVGDCEIYVRATTENLALMQKGFFLARNDNDMVCQIRKIEIDTDAEKGNYMIVTGVDCKAFLNQRVLWQMTNAEGNAETLLRSMVNNALGSTAESDRKLISPGGSLIFGLAEAAGFKDVTTEQASYKNIGEKTREYCRKYGWGYKVVLDDGIFKFALYKGENRANTVVFSDAYENLSTSKYVEDETHLGNVALVAGEGEGAARSRNVAGAVSGMDRHEIFVDARDISKTIKYSDLTDMYSGTIEHDGNDYVYNVTQLDVQIIDAVQLLWLQTDYPGGEIVTVDGQQYYRLQNEPVALLPSAEPEDSDDVMLYDIVYSVYLLTRGYEKLAEYGAITSFAGTIDPNMTFVYNKDYFLGDVVTVENEYGISLPARITEVVEVNDNSGHKIEPKYEYITEE